MGRAFEFRKARKFKRWGNMARVFTKLGKEITICAKQGGPEPENKSAFACLDADGQEGKHAEGKRGKSYQACCIKRLLRL